MQASNDVRLTKFALWQSLGSKLKRAVQLNNIAEQILWFETLLKGSIGFVMLLFPITAAKIAGLPHGNTAFWPRLFGVAMLGMSAAFAFEGYTQLTQNINARGLGLGGAIVINLIAILCLVGTLIFKGVMTKRGLLLIWSLVLLLILLILLEIAHA